MPGANISDETIIEHLRAGKRPNWLKDTLGISVPRSKALAAAHGIDLQVKKPSVGRARPSVGRAEDPTDGEDVVPSPSPNSAPPASVGPANPTDGPTYLQTALPICVFDVDGACTSESSARPGVNSCKEALGYQPDQQHCLGYRASPGVKGPLFPTHQSGATHVAPGIPPFCSTALPPGSTIPGHDTILIALAKADSLATRIDSYKMFDDPRYQNLKAEITDTKEWIRKAIQAI